MPSVLFIFTSADKTLTGGATGWYLPEAAHPYYILAPHVDIDFASPKGPNPPVDEGSVKNFTDADSVKFLTDQTVKHKLTHAKKLSEVNVKDYDAVFYVGGHGPILDLASDPTNAQLASKFWQEGKIVSAICHGPGALVGAVDSQGKSIFAGKAFTGLSNAEEEIVGAVLAIPFSLENRLVYLGGKYEKAAKPFESKVVVDGRLITGQNGIRSRFWECTSQSSPKLNQETRIPTIKLGIR